MGDAPRLLATYLNDHLAGSILGGHLARRIAKKNSDNDYGGESARIAKEIEEDKAQLQEIMDRVGARQKNLRLAGAWVAEKVMHMKPNGRLVGYSPLSRVLELETLVMGITGKLELWRSLERIEDDLPELDESQLKRLIDRAESQRERVEELRVRAAGEALTQD